MAILLNLVKKTSFDESVVRFEQFRRYMVKCLNKNKKLLISRISASDFTE